MKIQSHYSDYYDYMLSYGVDRNVFFNRKIIHVNKGIGKIEPEKYSLGYVCFCGDMYPFVVETEFTMDKTSPKAFPDYIINNQAVYYEDTIDILINKMVPKSEKYHRLEYKVQVIKKWMADKTIKPKHLSISKEYPYFYHLPETLFHAYIGKGDIHSTMSRGIIIQGPLTAVHFNQIMSSEETFQKISQWLVKDKPKTISIDDNIVLRDQKGFDKQSFKHRR